jgi:hypothetical protein
MAGLERSCLLLLLLLLQPPVLAQHLPPSASSPLPSHTSNSRQRPQVSQVRYRYARGTYSQYNEVPGAVQGYMPPRAGYERAWPWPNKTMRVSQEQQQGFTQMRLAVGMRKCDFCSCMALLSSSPLMDSLLLSMLSSSRRAARALASNSTRI